MPTKPNRLVASGVPVLAGVCIWGALGFSNPAPRITVNGKLITTDVPARIEDGRTLVPVRFVSEALGAQVSYDKASNTVVITSTTSPPLLKLNGEQTTWPYWYEDGVLYLEYRDATEMIKEYYKHPSYAVTFFKSSSTLTINTASYTVPSKKEGDFTVISCKYLLDQKIINYNWDPDTGNLSFKSF